MEFNYRYHGHSQVSDDAAGTGLHFAPDTLRPPTYFVANLAQHLPFREAISTLNKVVVSDLRFKARDRSAYLAWLAQHESGLLADFIGQSKEKAKRIGVLREELTQLRGQEYKLLMPFYKARRCYFDYLYKTDYNAWFVLDPVITVHPDEVFFECFSQDESSYGRLSCDYDVFKNISERAEGTTNIDYSAQLYNEFQKIRSYKETQFCIEPAGFAVQTGEQEEAYREEKIDLPDSWVRGFLQVSSAMSMPATVLQLHPMDIHNICLLLRRHKEKRGPRSLRFRLKPNQPVELIFDPWNHSIACPRSCYSGTEEQEIRIWGRRRLLILERLIPIARFFTVYLLGSGLPSFFVADLGALRFTLGLSGWTANDWSRLGNFDLLAPRTEVDENTQTRVFQALSKSYCLSANALAQQLQLDRDIVLGALAAYTQAGRVIYDLNKNLYRLRELSREPLPMGQLRFENEQEVKAHRFIEAALVNMEKTESGTDFLCLTGTVRDDAKKHQVSLRIDADQRLVAGQCSCDFYVRNKLYRGPCEHMIALRLYQGKKT